MFFNKIEGKITGDSLRNEIESLPDGRYQVEITSLDTRNLRQNALLWGWVYPHAQKLFEDSGVKLTIEQLHEYYKFQALRKRKKCPVTKRFRSIDGTTTTLSKKAFSKYLDYIHYDCIDKFGTGIPTCHEMEELYR